MIRDSWDGNVSPSPMNAPKLSEEAPPPDTALDRHHLPWTEGDDEVEAGIVKIMRPEEDGSWIRAAIPHLPRRLAAFYLLLNIGLPGSGTILSGWSALCVGRSRMRNQSFMVFINTGVGLAQFLTIPWLLVGWFWSVAWGIILWFLAEEDPIHGTPESSSLSSTFTPTSPSSWQPQTPEEFAMEDQSNTTTKSLASSEWHKEMAYIT